MVFETIRVGIVFNGIVTALVAMTALALVIFFLRRWQWLDLSTRAYVWFWVATMLVWTGIAFRYLFIGFGYLDHYENSFAYYYDLLIQASIFFTGPPLFYYLGMRIFHEPYIARVLALVSAGLGAVSMWFVLAPQGIVPPVLTYFSADASINTASFFIFSFQIVAIFILLIFDALYHHELYSAALIIYVAVGAIDQSKILLDWPLIVFRLFYIGAFLLVYVVTIQHEAYNEEYLIEEPTTKL